MDEEAFCFCVITGVHIRLLLFRERLGGDTPLKGSTLVGSVLMDTGFFAQSLGFEFFSLLR